MKSPLTEIPGVGKRTAAVMEALGIREASDLRGRDPEKLKWWYWKDKPYPEKEDL